MVGGAVSLFLGCGVGEGSTRAAGWVDGVPSRPRSAIELGVVFFAARGGLTLVAFGVDGSIGAGGGLILEAFGVDGSNSVGGGVSPGVEPEAVRFRPAIDWVRGRGVPSRVTCRPDRSARSTRYLVPLSLVLAAISFW